LCLKRPNPRPLNKRGLNMLTTREEFFQVGLDQMHKLILSSYRWNMEFHISSLWKLIAAKSILEIILYKLSWTLFPMGDSLFSGPPELLLESVLWFCDKGEVLWWSGGPPPPVKVGSGGINPSFMRFFCFIRRFWNQIFTCVSLSCSAPAISILLARVRYLLKWNSFSNSVNIFVVKLVRPVLLTPPGLGRNPYWSGLGAVE